MRPSEPDQDGPPIDLAASQEKERLRRENEDLRRQLAALKRPAHGSSDSTTPASRWRPSAITIWVIFLASIVLVAVAFFAGYIPLRKRQATIRAETQEQERALPRVEVVEVGRSSLQSGLALPGSIQAITEAPVLARADGYLQHRLVDIGDRVRTGQPLAEIDAPELDDQIRQGRATVQQAQAAVDQSLASYQQGKADTELARVTAERWARLAAQGIVSKQDNDQSQAQYQSKVSAMQALEKAIAVQRSNVAAAEASLARLDKLQGYRVVKAPFDGVITLRNVDTGALVSAGSTLLFRIAQTGVLRIYVNVPQTHANSVKPGQTARLTVTNLPGRQFTGRVARNASALDPATRTLLVEVQVPNPDGALFPGMYARVELLDARTNPPLLIPSDALIARADGTSVAVVRPDSTVHIQRIEVGRDYGDRMEVIRGLEAGERIIQNPGDAAREGQKVDAVAAVEKAKDPAGVSPAK